MKVCVLILFVFVSCAFAVKNGSHPNSANERFDSVIEDLLESFGDEIQPLVLSGGSISYTKSIFGKKMTFEATVDTVNTSGIDTAVRVGDAVFTRDNGTNTIEGVVGMELLDVVYKGSVKVNGRGPVLTVHYKLREFQARIAVSQKDGEKSLGKTSKYSIEKTGTYVVTHVENVPYGLNWIVRKAVSGITRLLKSRLEGRLQKMMDSTVGRSYDIHFHGLD